MFVRSSIVNRVLVSVFPRILGILAASSQTAEGMYLRNTEYIQSIFTLRSSYSTYSRSVVTTFLPAGRLWCWKKIGYNSDKWEGLVLRLWKCSWVVLVIFRCFRWCRHPAGRFPVPASSKPGSSIHRDCLRSSIGALPFYMTLVRYTGE